MQPDEFRRLYAGVAEDLRRYVVRLSDTKEDADDVFQEAFARLLASKTQPDDPQGRRLYLFRIATNLVQDRRRWKGRWRFETLLDRIRPALDADPAKCLDTQSALARLPPRSRALLWLAYVNGFSHREIAEIAGVAPASVRVLLARARKRFTAIVEEGD